MGKLISRYLIVLLMIGISIWASLNIYHQQNDLFVEINEKIAPTALDDFLTKVVDNQPETQYKFTFSNNQKQFLILRSPCMSDGQYYIISTPRFDIENRVLSIHYETEIGMSSEAHSKYLIYRINGQENYDVIRLFENGDETSFNISGN